MVKSSIMHIHIFLNQICRPYFLTLETGITLLYWFSSISLVLNQGHLCSCPWLNLGFQPNMFLFTPARTYFLSGLKSQVLKLTFLTSNDGEKWSRVFTLKFTEPLQNCCCPVLKNLPRKAELAKQVSSRYLWRRLVNFKMKKL